MVKPPGKMTQNTPPLEGYGSQWWPQYQSQPIYQQYGRHPAMVDPTVQERNTPVCTLSKAPKSPHRKMTVRNTPPHRSLSVARSTISDSELDLELPISVPDVLSLHPGESERMLSDEEIQGGQVRNSPKRTVLDSTSS